jgi:hypothetical protein
MRPEARFRRQPFAPTKLPRRDKPEEMQNCIVSGSSQDTFETAKAACREPTPVKITRTSAPPISVTWVSTAPHIARRNLRRVRQGANSVSSAKVTRIFKAKT